MTLEVRDAEELILVLVGYHKLLTERDLELIQDNSILAKLEEQQQQDEDQQGIHLFNNSSYTLQGGQKIMMLVGYL